MNPPHEPERSLGFSSFEVGPLGVILIFFASFHWYDVRVLWSRQSVHDYPDAC